MWCSALCQLQASNYCTGYSQLSRLMEGAGMQEQLRHTGNLNFIFYIPTTPLARHRVRDMLFSHISHSLDTPVCARRWVIQGCIHFYDKNCLYTYLYCVILWSKYSVNQTKIHARIICKPNNLHPDNRECTVLTIEVWLTSWLWMPCCPSSPQAYNTSVP